MNCYLILDIGFLLKELFYYILYMESMFVPMNRRLTQEERDKIMALYLRDAKPKNDTQTTVRAKDYLTKEER